MQKKRKKKESNLGKKKKKTKKEEKLGKKYKNKKNTVDYYCIVCGKIVISPQYC